MDKTTVFSSISSLSGWYRLLVMISIVWVMLALIYSTNWRLFVLYGVLPATIFWGLIWIEAGFRTSRNVVQYKNE